ncbi:hypothetical protein PUMCH_000263 [Australozyma saopauloensis]|uniref:Uncharacterized protein n=1 Tax=Australozyma saopauloensis TaxID=291208 RepID=A0AAX4H409_9ASCO|nr:hypothetical protein PUMCH_000263 [[Candida] saopauloensis]
MMHATTSVPDETNSGNIRPIDPNYVRKGIEDILRISEAIRLLQNCIIDALNYSGPSLYSNMANVSSDAQFPRPNLAAAPSYPNSSSVYPSSSSLYRGDLSCLPPTRFRNENEEHLKTSQSTAGASSAGGPLVPSNALPLISNFTNAENQRVDQSLNSIPSTRHPGPQERFTPMYKATVPEVGSSEVPNSASSAAVVEIEDESLMDECARLLRQSSRKRLKRVPPGKLPVQKGNSFVPYTGYGYMSNQSPYISTYRGFQSTRDNDKSQHSNTNLAKTNIQQTVKLPNGSNSDYQNCKEQVYQNGSKTPHTNRHSARTGPVNLDQSEQCNCQARVPLGIVSGKPACSGKNEKATKSAKDLPKIDETHESSRAEVPLKRKTRGSRKNLRINAKSSEGQDLKENGVEPTPTSSNRAEPKPETLSEPNSAKSDSIEILLTMRKLPRGLLSGLTVLPDQKIVTVEAKNIPLNQPPVPEIELKLTPGSKQPVSDVFIDEQIKAAPMVSQPPSAQLDYVTEVPAPHKEPDEAVNDPEESQDDEAQDPNTMLQGSIMFKDSDVFNFMIFNGSEDNAKKNFMNICETVWDRLQELMNGSKKLCECHTTGGPV